MCQHDWQFAYVLTDATCEHTGVSLYVCTICSLTKVGVAEMLEHDYQKTVVSATCTEQGCDKYTCKVCGHTYKDNVVEPNGTHVFEGETCSSCGENIATVAVASYDVSKAMNGSITEYVVPRSDSFFDVVLLGSGEMIDETNTSSPLYAHDYASKVKNIYIANGITNIGGDAFYFCSVTEVLIPNSVTSIDDGAFEHCDSLVNILIPNSVTRIGERAFSSCRSLTNITIPDSVTRIEDRTFAQCHFLTNIIIGNGVTSIGSEAFVGTYRYNNEENWENDVLYIDGWCIKAKESIRGSFTIKEGTKGIADYAFKNCTVLTRATIPNSVKSIGRSAFCACSSLAEIIISNSVVRIDAYAFQDCSSLTSVTFENPNGWWYASSDTATSGTAISATDLADTATAANYLRNTYYNYYWFRSEE